VLLTDTNIWLAAGDRRSRHHHDCSALLAQHSHELAATTAVIAETAWLLLDRGGPEAQAAFVAMITTGRLLPVDLTDRDWIRVHQLVTEYSDLRLDVVDASTIAIAERLELTTIATLDHRDFLVVRPSHVDGFNLIP